MAEWTQAEQYLLEQVRKGSEGAWAQLVERYQGRLLAFARRRLPRGADAEDLVQDTFLRFLRGLPDFRGQSSVETYLFMILRRRTIELYRVRKPSAVQLPDASGADESAAPMEPAARDLTASGYARRDEHRDAARAALATALRGLTASLQRDCNFADLELLEMIFFAQRPNQEIARALTLKPEQVAMAKHRWLKQVRDRVGPMLAQRGAAPGRTDPIALDSLLTEIWETERLTCPKRTTLGGYLLNTLEAPWTAYVRFHLTTVACPFCVANLDDLQKQTRSDPRPLRDRILQSTVGFFRKNP
jgi:RNA polymerase sigma factor (sigma-70 family)